MTNSGERKFGQELHTWVQTIGIIIAAAWGIYTFVYKEITAPKSAPVNITMNLELKKIGTDGLKNQGQHKGLVPVEMKISARNPTSREIYLLPSAWIAYGYKVVPKHVPPLSDKAIVSADETFTHTLMHSRVSEVSLVGAGGLFSDEMLKPNEVVARVLIIYVPSGKYDSLQVDTLMPTTSRADKIKLDWKIGEDREGSPFLEPTMYVRADEKWKEMETDKRGAYSYPEYELQMSKSASEISLW